MKIVVAISGASGSIYARRLIDKLTESSEVEKIGLVFSIQAKRIWLEEAGELPKSEKKIKIYDNNDYDAPFASGSCTYNAMVICPCSSSTMSKIATGISDNLITRAADVMLKERRKLIIVNRETPLNLIQIRNMESITLSGGIIMPASPGFYNKPQSIEELVDTVVYRIMSILQIKNEEKHWRE